MHADMTAIAPLSKDEEHALILAAQTGDRRAEETLIRSQMKSITMMARRYSRSGRVDEGDLIADGIIALIDAIRRFDSSDGFRLWSFAQYQIREAMQSSVVFQSSTFDIPSRTMQRYWSAKSKSVDDEGAYKLATSSGHMTPATYAALEAALRASSTDSSPGEDIDVPRVPQPRQASDLADPDLQDTTCDRIVAHAALAVLDERERVVVELYFGFDGGGERTDLEVAGKLNLSRPTVTRIRLRAMSKLSEALREG